MTISALESSMSACSRAQKAGEGPSSPRISNALILRLTLAGDSSPSRTLVRSVARSATPAPVPRLRMACSAAERHVSSSNALMKYGTASTFANAPSASIRPTRGWGRAQSRREPNTSGVRQADTAIAAASSPISSPSLTPGSAMSFCNFRNWMRASLLLSRRRHGRWRQ